MDCKILLKDGGHDVVLLKDRKVVLLRTWFSSDPLKIIACDISSTEKCKYKIWH